MYIPGRSRTCSTPSRTWISADPYRPGLVAPARLVVVLATSPPSWNAGAPDSRRRVSGGRRNRVEPTRFYQSGVTPNAFRRPVRGSKRGLELLALQAFPRVGTHDHLHLGDAPGADRRLGSLPDLLGQEPHLRPPGSGGRGDHQDTPFEADRGGLGGQPGAHHRRPIGRELADRHPPRERPLAEEAVDDVADPGCLEGPFVLAVREPLGMRHRDHAPRAATVPADTSRTIDEGSGTWASSATLTKTCPRSASRSPTSR